MTLDLRQEVETIEAAVGAATAKDVSRMLTSICV